MPKNNGHLVIAGGPADKLPDRELLARAAHLAGGVRARVAILVAGNKVDSLTCAPMMTAFEGLGVASVGTVALGSREAADGGAWEDLIAEATCMVLVTDHPETLAGVLRDTALEHQIHQAFERRGACIMAVGGASSALASRMVRSGRNDIHPRKDLIDLAPGLAFLDRVAIDPNFSDKQRMGRLLSIVAQAPELLGVGIDARTALVIEPGQWLEVIGNATVTLLDGRSMSCCEPQSDAPDAMLAMGNVQLHLLPAGFRFDMQAGLPAVRGVMGPRVPAALRDVAEMLVSAHPRAAHARRS